MALYIQRPATYEAVQWNQPGDCPQVTFPLTAEQRVTAAQFGFDPDTCGFLPTMGDQGLFVVPGRFIIHPGSSTAEIMTAESFNMNYVANPYT